MTQTMQTPLLMVLPMEVCVDLPPLLLHLRMAAD
jgi:hypothetical protein